jgi:DNA-binding transcriptional LysR family regulator
MIWKSYQSGLELRHIAAFATVAKTLSFREAARQLGIAQSAVSVQIRLMEARLGVQLFERTTRQVQLTATGRHLLARAERAMQAAEDFIDGRLLGRGPSGRLSIWYGTQAMFTVLPELLSRLHHEAPDIEFDLVDATTEQMVRALREERADVAFLHPPVERKGLRIHALLSESFVAVLPRKHKLARGKGPLHFSDLNGESLILHARVDGPRLYDSLQDALRRSRSVPVYGPVACQPQNTIGLAAAGVGIGFVCESMKGLARPEVVFRSIAGWDARLELALASRERHRSEAVDWFWNMVTN